MIQFHIRNMIDADAQAVAHLLGELGYPNRSNFVLQKRRILRQSGTDLVIVAEVRDRIVGVAHLHHCELFHVSGRLGRIMALVVKEGYRGRDVGKKLILALEERARKSGCVVMEVTSGERRQGAHLFYEKLGYVEEPKRFVKYLK